MNHSYVAVGFGTIAYGVVTGMLARRLGRSIVPWTVAGILFGPVIVPLLMAIGATGKVARFVRRWVVVTAVVGATIGGTLLGARLFLHGNHVTPEKAVRVVKGKVVPEKDGPTAFAISMVGNMLFLFAGGVAGGVAGLVVSPVLALAAESLLSAGSRTVNRNNIV